MRRRRFPRGPIRPRPGLRAASARRPIPPKLREAHRSFEAGDYQRAADLYLELAGKAHQRGIPQAPNLYLRGAAAVLKAGNQDAAMETVKKGLGILVAGQRWLRLKKTGAATVGRFKSEGQEELAGQIQDWLEEQVPENIKGSEAWRRPAQGARSGHMKLPATCGQCGGPVHPEEAEWLGGGQVVCSYCGAVLA